MELGGTHEDPTRRDGVFCFFFFLYRYVDELLGLPRGQWGERIHLLMQETQDNHWVLRSLG